MYVGSEGGRFFTSTEITLIHHPVPSFSRNREVSIPSQSAHGTRRANFAASVSVRQPVLEKAIDFGPVITSHQSKEADYSHRVTIAFFTIYSFFLFPTAAYLPRIAFTLDFCAFDASLRSFMHGWAAWVVGLFVLLLNL